MRIPVPTVIVCCLIAAAVMWFTGTRNKDFSTPPTPEKLAEITKKWKQGSLYTPPPKSANELSMAESSLVTPQPPNAETKAKTLDTGNLQHAPGLSEYGELKDSGCTAMIELASRLETIGESQRAQLAWERVMDVTNPTDDQRGLAATAIKRLRLSLPPWNPDPAAAISLTLHAGASVADKKVLEDALVSVSKIISAASENILQISHVVSIGKNQPAGTLPSLIPIAIWFSRAGDDAAETPPISFTTNPGENDTLTKQIETAAYSLLRAELARKTSFSTLPDLTDKSNINDLIKFHVTRLMWREFAKGISE